MSANQAQSEELTYPRHNVRIAIFNSTFQKKLLSEYSMNISIGGVFVETNYILPVDKEVILKFTLPESNNIIITKARVAWTNDPGFLKKTFLPPGMGLQFLNLSLNNMRAIRTFLDKVAKKSHQQYPDLSVFTIPHRIEKNCPGNLL